MYQSQNQNNGAAFHFATKSYGIFFIIFHRSSFMAESWRNNRVKIENELSEADPAVRFETAALR